MSELVLSRKRQGAQDAVDTLETFEAFEAFDKHGLPAFVRGVDAEAPLFFLALFRTGTLPRAAEQLGISLSSANRMLAKLRTYLTVRLGWHGRTHADPGSQLIRAQLLALIQKRFGLPAGE